MRLAPPKRSAPTTPIDVDSVDLVPAVAGLTGGRMADLVVDLAVRRPSPCSSPSKMAAMSGRCARRLKQMAPAQIISDLIVFNGPHRHRRPGSDAAVDARGRPAAARKQPAHDTSCSAMS